MLIMEYGWCFCWCLCLLGSYRLQVLLSFQWSPFFPLIWQNKTRIILLHCMHIQLFQKKLSEEKQKVFKPRLQGNVGCFKSAFCWQTNTPLNCSLIFIRHLYWTTLIILVFKKAQGKIMFQSKCTLAYSHLCRQFCSAN